MSKISELRKSLDSKKKELWFVTKQRDETNDRINICKNELSRLENKKIDLEGKYFSNGVGGKIGRAMYEINKYEAEIETLYENENARELIYKEGSYNHNIGSKQIILKITPKQIHHRRIKYGSRTVTRRDEAELHGIDLEATFPEGIDNFKNPLEDKKK